MELFFDRDDYGCRAVWAGSCDSKEAFFNYCFSRYEGGDLTCEEFQAELQRMFLPENQDRDVEEELREHFSSGMLNQFTYDFAVVFDEDGVGCDVRDFFTESFRELLSGSPCAGEDREILIEEFEKRGICLSKPCNCFLIIPTIYEGYYNHIKREGIELWYLMSCRLPNKSE